MYLEWKELGEMFYIYKCNSQVLLSSLEIQSSQPPVRSQGRAAAPSPGPVGCFLCPAQCAQTANGLRWPSRSSQRCINSASGVLSILHLPYLPALGCQSAVTCLHISSVCTSPGCQQGSWWVSAPGCQSSLFLFYAREIFWLRETKKPGQQWLVVRHLLLYVNVRS